MACMHAGVRLDLWCRCVIGSASRGVRTNRSITLLTVVPNLDASLADKGTRLPRVGSQVKQAEQARLPSLTNLTIQRKDQKEAKVNTV